MAKTVGEIMVDVKRIQSICNTIMDYEMKKITLEEFIKKFDISWARSYLTRYEDLLLELEVKEPKK